MLLQILPSFNSILMQGKERANEYTRKALEFQFHSDARESWHAQPGSCQKHRFNSILMQGKEYKPY